MMEGPCADSEEKHEPVSDTNTAAIESLKALDPDRPIREADIASTLLSLTKTGDWEMPAVLYSHHPKSEAQRRSNKRRHG